MFVEVTALLVLLVVTVDVVSWVVVALLSMAIEVLPVYIFKLLPELYVWQFAVPEKNVMENQPHGQIWNIEVELYYISSIV